MIIYCKQLNSMQSQNKNMWPALSKPGLLPILKHWETPVSNIKHVRTR